METLYQVLGVYPNATFEEIKGAYRALALSLHPDKKGGNHERFSEVTYAYAVLSDEPRRLGYDARLRMERDVCQECGGAGRKPKLKGFHVIGHTHCPGCKGAGFKAR